MLGADGLTFLGKFGAVLLAVAEDGDEAAGPSEKAIDGPRGEDGAFAELARPVKAEDAGGVVVEDDLVGTQMHFGMQIADCRIRRGRICALLAVGAMAGTKRDFGFAKSRFKRKNFFWDE